MDLGKSDYRKKSFNLSRFHSTKRLAPERNPANGYDSRPFRRVSLSSRKSGLSTPRKFASRLHNLKNFKH
jgi:hypothetical protein